MSDYSIVLASQSPRRKQLLLQIGVQPLCKPVNIDETQRLDEDSKHYCRRLALEKAQKARGLCDERLPILGSDTIVILGSKTLGKPKDIKDACYMLECLSNTTHLVMTAVAIIHAGKQRAIESISEVTFAEITADAIKAYVKTKEPMDKAGSYAIQGQAAAWIKNISGSYSGIMGLPLYETAQLLREFR